MEYIIRWRNQSGVKESGMTKWILQLRDDKGTLIKTKEDTTASHLENFSDVEIRMALTQTEALSQSATNKMLIYFDSVRDSTKLGELTVLFDRTKLPLDVASVARSDVTIPSGITIPVGGVLKCSSNDPIGVNDYYKYEYVGNDKIKYTPYKNSSYEFDCGKYTYTGVKYRNESTDNRCGPNNDYKRCPGSQCCSQFGWCGGQKGEKSEYCTSMINIDGSKNTTEGYYKYYDGIDINNFKMIDTSIPSSRQLNCGSVYGKCSGNECCMMISVWPNPNGICGGNKPDYSEYCSYMDSFSWTSGFTWRGSLSEYDGDGTFPTPPIPMISKNMVFKCSNFDPLRNNNQIVYKWENNSLKNISAVPPGYAVYTIPSCDGIEYGGPG